MTWAALPGSPAAGVNVGQAVVELHAVEPELVERLAGVVEAGVNSGGVEERVLVETGQQLVSEAGHEVLLSVPLM